MRIISFCADGIEQAAANGFYDWVRDQDADIICIQDLKAQEYDLQADVYFPDGYFAYFFDSPQPKTNGVALYVRKIPKAIMTGLGMADADIEARYIQADYDRISIGSILAPVVTAGDDDAFARKRRFFQHLHNHLNKIRNKRREYIICGDWQVAHQPRDVKNAATYEATPGYLAEEREWLNAIYDELGYADAFRQVNADDDEFTWWPNGNRAGDGWRTDLQVVSSGIKGRVEYGAIYKNQAFSNHNPIIMDYDIEL